MDEHEDDTDVVEAGGDWLLKLGLFFSGLVLIVWLISRRRSAHAYDILEQNEKGVRT